jgi:hypothetical protein
MAPRPVGLIKYIYNGPETRFDIPKARVNLSDDIIHSNAVNKRLENSTHVRFLEQPRGNMTKDICGRSQHMGRKISYGDKLLFGRSSCLQTRVSDICTTKLAPVRSNSATQRMS